MVPVNHPEYDNTYVHCFYALTATARVPSHNELPKFVWIKQHHIFRLKQYCRSPPESKKTRTTLQETTYHTMRWRDHDKTTWCTSYLLQWLSNSLLFQVVVPNNDNSRSNQKNYEHYHQHQYSPNKPLAAQNIMQEPSHTKPRHNAYVATSEQIQNQYWKHVRSHRKNYTYFNVHVFHRSMRHYPRELREKRKPRTW